MLRVGALSLLGVIVALLGWVGGASARPASTVKAVRYLGYTVRVPRSWPVYDLSKHPTVCVRFNRHAVYLGTPGSAQQCPAHAAGRSEAILIEPVAAGSARAGGSSGTPLPSVTDPGAQPAQGSSGELAVPSHGVLVTATWRTQPGVITRALGVRSTGALHSGAAKRSLAHQLAGPRAATAAAAQSAGTVYTGLGFDPCNTPSASAMSAWGASPYRGVGVYVGGANMACSQPNLTASWVSAETAAGWHLIPTYVGLQAPSNSCGCAAISSSSASSEGIAAANDAVTHASAVGIGPGNPIYFDMENYSRGGSNTSAVLTFLSAWTTQLHTLGYLSGVYSSSSSGITDLASQSGTGFVEPDDIWIADWNGAQSTSDAAVSGSEWASHQRLHQYKGGHDETYGGVTLNIDNDYLDGATVGLGGAATIASGPPTNISPPAIGGVARVARTLSVSSGAWSGTPGISYAYQWQLCTPACTNIVGATGKTLKLVPADLDASVRVMVAASNPAGSTQSATGYAGPVAPAGYWLYTAGGSVFPSASTSSFGSPAGQRVHTTSIVGMASTPDARGYWLVSSSGRSYAFGDAARVGANAHHQRVAGIVADPRGGFWLFTARGNVYGSAGAGWFGSVPGASAAPIVGMASAWDGRGYWLVSSSGWVYPFGDAGKRATNTHRRVAGIVADPRGGYWLYSNTGNVYRAGGAPSYGSLPSHGIRSSSVVSMVVTWDGGGYWLISSSGRVYTFGDAAKLGWHPHGHSVLGAAGPAPWSRLS